MILNFKVYPGSVYKGFFIEVIENFLKGFASHILI